MMQILEFYEDPVQNASLSILDNNYFTMRNSKILGNANPKQKSKP